MDINDDVVLELINKFIVSKRLTKIEILHIVKLVSISKNIRELEENFTWEYY